MTKRKDELIKQFQIEVEQLKAKIADLKKKPEKKHPWADANPFTLLLGGY